jgi:hypothetical protein
MRQSVSYDQIEAWPCFDTVLVEERANLRSRYVKADPFPHLVFDNLFPAQCLEDVARDFDRAHSVRWRKIQSGFQSRQVSVPDSPLPPVVQQYFNIVNSGPFIRFLSDITGVPDLIPDPALYGGGMHQVRGGGTFDIHVDFEQHPRTLLKNRLVVITYLNEGWGEEDGGDLELWRLKPRQRVTSVLPIFGRTVIMGQSKVAAHGHLQPIRDGRTRRSVTAYFYTNGFLPMITNDLLPTVYVSRKGQSLSQSAELMLRLITPPFILGGLKSLTARARRARRPIR